MGASVARALKVAGFGLLVAWSDPGIAQAAPRTTGEVTLPSCVSDARLGLTADDDRALLDDTDRAALGSAMLQRYPVLGRDGFAPAAILMWRKAGGDWVYVALAGSGRAQPGWCFTASFNANVFDITPALLRKYFFQGAGRA